MSRAIQYNPASDTMTPGDSIGAFLPGVLPAAGSTVGNLTMPALVLKVEHVVSSTDTPGVLCMSPQTLQIQTLGAYNLKRPLFCVVERDEDEWLATAPDVDRAFGLGETVGEAIEALKSEIASLYEDLEECDNFTADWLAVHRFLRESIAAL